MASEPLPVAQDATQPEPAQSAPSASSGPRRLGLALVVIAAAQLMIVLDATIVNVALPHIQRALDFSGAGLEWVVTAYSLAFGSLLLLGGRLGDIYGRRRVFMTGILIFSLARSLGGLATSEWWIMTARAVQGAGGALAAPTALALIATTFPAGPPRNRAFGVYAGMSGAGGADRPAARRRAHDLRLVALGVLRERADRHRRGLRLAPIALVADGALAHASRHPRRGDQQRAAWRCSSTA